MAGIRRGAAGALALVVGLSGCATYFPVNQPLESWSRDGYRAERRFTPERSEELLLMVAFSGGGTRAAAFAYGILEELDATRVRIGGRDTTLLDELDHLSGVSGGSFPAAYFGLHGRGLFEDFEERFLKRNVQRSLLVQLLWPWNWALLFSPYFERSDLVARYLDRVLFDDATFADLEDRNGPLVQITATDLATGAPFSFIQEQFDFLCSDLLPYRISRAVAASSAVPGALSPLTLRNFAGACEFQPPDWIQRELERGDRRGRAYVNALNLESYRDSDSRRFIRLVDGGISDNLAVRGPFEAELLRPLPEKRPERLGALRSMVLVVVNAATSPETQWEEMDEAPPLSSIIDQTATVQLNRYSIETLELVRSTFEEWNRTASQWTEPAGFHLVEVDFTRVPDPTERRYLNNLPTSLNLDDEQVDRLRAAARETLRESEAFGGFLREVAPVASAPNR